ncbi:Alcohol dehydrogenase GroES domain protein OS=Tsukamurella paurometabola (strain ATCC 8368 / DSM/ CCUG 35730 / CIP 100753 / JCM 10117 / KCTC 9821 / NBRC 16120 / NCIMB 702349 / NCTC 13040) OX=521096 GN=Tpau_1508 PE=4 SV=1 [Tsukamurella paurometabola]|uniref:Alcohol dehydrogenase GroES domain protein n=2 Tax=Tsukamurella paurometabola TaxID=2061 RepID=D5UXP0_TSUPD|nr:Alcohol dehydrogenase GroES domain protein [Tsukamurella paurometabola DSM 20162]SUP30335.1 Alcohol dehydrogenase [Tsukamurella paurometabola]
MAGEEHVTACGCVEWNDRLTKGERMRVIGFEHPGGPEVLRWFDVPEPAVRPGQVKVRVVAAAVNPSDVVARAGVFHERYSSIAPPFVPGWDAAGVVVESAHPAWRTGDDVVAVTLPVFDGGGAYAERIVVNAASVAAKPAELSFEEAATFPMNGLTALLALDDADVDAGSTLAVSGAAGAVGGLVVELAARRGVTVIADAADTDVSLVRGFGADRTIPRGPGFGAAVRAVIPKGVDAVVDAALLRDEAVPAVRDGGIHVSLRTPEAGGGMSAPDRRITVRYPVVAAAVADGQRLRALMELAATGAISARVADVLPAGSASEAHRRLESGGLRGRLVLRFDQ